MKNHHEEFAHLRVVPLAEQVQADRGNAMVFGPFPPLITPSTGHACETLHLLKAAGYRVTSATGPGLAMAGYQVNFTSNRRFEDSTDFVSEEDAIDHAVVYAKSAEFARISKPSWHSRRLEELRRIRFLMRVIDHAKTTTLVLENHPFTSRYQFCFWVVGKAWAWLRRSKVSIVNRGLAADVLARRMTGIHQPPTPAYLAEASAYEAALQTLGPDMKLRLTCMRSQLCAQSWAAKADYPGANAVTDDLNRIVSAFRKHDLRSIPQFRLLWQNPSQAGDVDQSGRKSRAFDRAHQPDPAHVGLKLPISRYMTHLRDTLGLTSAFPLTTRAEGRQFLNWYLAEAGAKTPEGRVPVPPALRDFVGEVSRNQGTLHIPSETGVVHTTARNDNPFPLSAMLVNIFMANDDLSAKYDIDDPVDRLSLAVEVVLRAPKGDMRQLLGPTAFGYLAAPIGGNGMCLTRIEYLLALYARFELSGTEAIERPWEDLSIRRWVQGPASDVFPNLRHFSGRSPRRAVASKRLAITGLPNSETGVGSNLHMSAAAFRKLGLAPDIHDVADGLRKLENRDLASCRRALKRPVGLHHLNADQVPQVLTASAIANNADMYNIGFLLWEFDVLPKTHRLALDMLDEIWVPSQFLRDTYAAATTKPVHTVLKGLHVPQVAPVPLERFGVEGEAFTFLTCFDFHSSVARKNPLAAVRGFQAAFGKERKDVRLIIKTTPIEARHWGDPDQQMEHIRAAIAEDPRITLVAEYLSFNDLLGLIAASDCLVSAHRAEGFGLIPAYALALRTPVISTDYSGTTDFCTTETSYPVGYKLAEVRANQVLHPMDGARWAEIDHDHLVETLRYVAENSGPARKKALRGARLISTRYALDRQAERYAKRLRAIDALI